MHFSLVLLILLAIIINNNQTKAIHITGNFKTNQFFKFITRFGFQPTDLHDTNSTQGYIYGNVTIKEKDYFQNYTTNEMPLITLAILDYKHFIDYYNKRLIRPRSDACSLMFEHINVMAYFYECNEQGKEDFIRRIPCNDKYCPEEDKNSVINGNHQFTFKIRDYNQARFWYLTIVSCTRNLKGCEWKYLGDYNLNDSILLIPGYTIEYDIWLVNGNPNSISNRFEHQYTYELHDIFEIYLSSLIIYLLIMPFIIYRLYYYFHYLYLQLLFYIGIEVICRLMSLIHNLVFSFDGNGVYVFDFFSNFLEALASSVLILILISIAKGWTIRTKYLKTSHNFYMLGFLLQTILVTSHMIALSTIDPVFNTNSYETVAGYVELSVRFVCMVWFVYELKETFGRIDSNSNFNGNEEELIKNNNNNQQDQIDYDLSDFEDETVYEINGRKYKSLNTETNDQQQATSFTSQDNKKSKEERYRSYQKFYLHYGACSLVWFIYLPVLIFITSFISELYRLRLVLSRFYVL